MMRQTPTRLAWVVGIAVTLHIGLLSPARCAEPQRTRSFLFTYEATVTGLAVGQKARIWLPVPSTDSDQSVIIVKQDLPAPGSMGVGPEYGNHILYVTAVANGERKIPLTVVYRVTRREVSTESEGGGDSAQGLERYLKADTHVPVGGKSLRLLSGRPVPQDQQELGRVLYDVVNNQMRYSKKGSGWGRGDADWACDSGYGNCTDFHSLFISLARSFKIPSRFEIGFLLPEQRGQGEIAGYHCWAKFKPQGGGWVPIDISEANKHPALKDYYFGHLTADRVAFSAGRDLRLVPSQDGPPLNFFVYPYVEVESKPYPNERIHCRFSYQDVSADSK